MGINEYGVSSAEGTFNTVNIDEIGGHLLSIMRSIESSIGRSTSHS